MQQGWVKLHRKIQDHWIYKEKRVFSKYEAWIDLLFMANHKNNKALIDGELINVEKGQFITSVRKLCDKWSWSNTKVNNFLKMLEKDGMITKKSDTKKTVITLVNYTFYHESDNEKTSQKHHESDTEASQKHTNKNVKNVKNDKKNNKRYSRKRVYDETSNYYQLAIFFYKQIQQNNPNHKKPNFQTWSDDIRKMIELDKRTEEQVRYLMKWVQQDDFEMTNVLSPAKMRKRFDQLAMKVKRESKQVPSNVTPITQGAKKYNYGF